MSRQKILLWLLTLANASTLLASAAGAQTPAPRPDDFAYGIEISIDGSSALYRVTLPLAVYRHTQQPKLGDLRVFNAAGEPVPHSVRPPNIPPSEATNRTPALIRLAHFPVYAEPGIALNNLSLQVTTSAAGAILKLDATPGSGPNGSERPPSAYLIDASATQKPLRALTLDWPLDSATTRNGYSGTVTLAHSDDLARWRTLASNAPLAALRYQGQVLQQRRIEFTPSRAKYLRLSSSGALPPLITAIDAEPTDADTNATDQTDLDLRQWLSSDGQPAEGLSGAYHFDLGANLPIDRLQVELPQQNTLVRASWWSRRSKEDDWRKVNVAAGALYRLQIAGNELRSPAIRLAPRTHRYWRLQVDQSGGGLGSGALPTLNAGWIPAQLLFVARGNGPFTLAYGAAVPLAAAGLPIAQLLADGNDNSGLATPPAKLGVQRDLGGAARLHPPPPPLAWKTYTLWSVLLVAVAVLGLLATRLLRQLNDEHKS